MENSQTLDWEEETLVALGMNIWLGILPHSLGVKVHVSLTSFVISLLFLFFI